MKALAIFITRVTNSANVALLRRNLRRRRLAIGSGLLLAGALGLYLASPREPRYEGRSLSGWLESLDTFTHQTSHGIPPSFAMLAARRRIVGDAIVHMGDSVYPWLFDWLRATAWSAKWDRALAPVEAKKWPLISAGATGVRRLLGPRLSSSSAVLIKHRNARRAFSLLGTNALPAVPGLLSLAQEADPATRRQAYFCLAYIRLQRQALIPLLTPLLQHTNQAIANNAQAYLWDQYREELRAEGLVRTNGPVPSVFMPAPTPP
jgi:hypothetical protein